MRGIDRGGDHQHLRVRLRRDKSAGGLEAIDAAVQGATDDHRVGMQLGGHLQSLFAVRRDARDLDVRRSAKASGEPCAHHGMEVDDHDPDPFLNHAHRRLCVQVTAQDRR